MRNPFPVSTALMASAPYTEMWGDLCPLSIPAVPQHFPEMLTSSPCPLSHCRVDMCSLPLQIGKPDDFIPITASRAD